MQEISNQEEKKWLSQLEELGDLDVKNGVLYCNGEAEYIDVLRCYCEESAAILWETEQFFQQQNWKNYIIAVHGIKSAMRSIGAVALSEVARQLEFAGKEQRFDDLIAHHSELVESYKAFFAKLQEYEWLYQVEEETYVENRDKPELEDDQFDKLINDMECAMFSLDGEVLSQLLVTLQQYQYKGTDLNSLLAPAKRKIEMTDYMSAVDFIIEQKNKLVSQ